MAVEIALDKDDAAPVMGGCGRVVDIHPDFSYMRLAIVNIVSPTSAGWRHRGPAGAG